MRAPPNVKSPVPQGRGNRAPNDDRAGNQTNKHIDTHSAPPGQRIITAIPAVKVLAAHGSTLAPGVLREQFGPGVLTRHTSDLAVIADWRDELHAKIRRAQMRLELVGLDHEEQDLLADEVQAFKQLCRALMATKTPAVASRRAA